MAGLGMETEFPFDYEDELDSKPAMSESLRVELCKLNQQPKRQDGALDQLRDLKGFAYRLGMDDAAALIWSITSQSGR
jgi:hypothetical protein